MNGSGSANLSDGTDETCCFGGALALFSDLLVFAVHGSHLNKHRKAPHLVTSGALLAVV